MKLMYFKLLIFFYLACYKFQIKNGLQFLIMDIYCQWFFRVHIIRGNKVAIPNDLPVIREREPLQGDLERSSPSFSTVLLPGRELVPDPLLLVQNDTQTEVSSSHNAFSMCKLRWMKVQCPTVPRYPSRLFCLCTGNRDVKMWTKWVGCEPSKMKYWHTVVQHAVQWFRIRR